MYKKWKRCLKCTVHVHTDWSSCYGFCTLVCRGSVCMIFQGEVMPESCVLEAQPACRVCLWSKVRFWLLYKVNIQHVRTHTCVHTRTRIYTANMHTQGTTKESKYAECVSASSPQCDSRLSNVRSRVIKALKETQSEWKTHGQQRPQAGMHELCWH